MQFGSHERVLVRSEDRKREGGWDREITRSRKTDFVLPRRSNPFSIVFSKEGGKGMGEEGEKEREKKILIRPNETTRPTAA